MIHDVDADAAVLSRGDGDLDLGTDAVGARRELAAARQVVETREWPDALRDLVAMRGRDQWLDTLQHPLIGLDVDAGRGVRQTLARHFLDLG